MKKTQNEVEETIIRALQNLEPADAIDALANVSSFVFYTCIPDSKACAEIIDHFANDVKRCIAVLFKEDENNGTKAS